MAIHSFSCQHLQRPRIFRKESTHKVSKLSHIFLTPGHISLTIEQSSIDTPLSQYLKPELFTYFHSGSLRSAEFCIAFPKVTIYIFFYHSHVLSATSGWHFITTTIASVSPEVDFQTLKQSGHPSEFLLCF